MKTLRTLVFPTLPWVWTTLLNFHSEIYTIERLSKGEILLLALKRVDVAPYILLFSKTYSPLSFNGVSLNTIFLASYPKDSIHPDRRWFRVAEVNILIPLCSIISHGP